MHIVTQISLCPLLVTVPRRIELAWYIFDTGFGFRFSGSQLSLCYYSMLGRYIKVLVRLFVSKKKGENTKNSQKKDRPHQWFTSIPSRLQHRLAWHIGTLRNSPFVSLDRHQYDFFVISLSAINIADMTK